MNGDGQSQFMTELSSFNLKKNHDFLPISYLLGVSALRKRMEELKR